MRKMQKLNSLKRIIKTAKEIAAQEGISSTRIFFDMLGAFVFHGATREDYEALGFVRLSNFARSGIVTCKRLFQIEKWFNAPAAQKVVDNKCGFLENFGEFLGRGWIAPSDVSDEDLRSFLKKNPVVILKPEDASQGEGVRKLNSAELLGDPAKFSELKNRGGGNRRVYCSTRRNGGIQRLVCEYDPC